MSTLRGDITLLTHGGDPPLTAAALLVDGILDGDLEVFEGRRLVAPPRREPAAPLMALLRSRILAGAPGSPHEWIHRTLAFAPAAVAAELVAAGAAAPRGGRLPLSVDARAEAAARARIAGTPALAGLLYARGLGTGDPLPPDIHALPAAVRTIIRAVRPAARMAA